MSASRGPRAAVHAAVRGIFIPVYARELDQTAHAQQPDRPMTLQSDETIPLQLREGAGDSLDGQAEEMGDIEATHG
jgi:hypothetical protein